MWIASRTLGLVMAVACGAAGTSSEEARGARPSAAEVSADRRDELCGPYCLQFVLRHMGQRRGTELYDIIRDARWDQDRPGLSLAAMAQFLEARSVHTAAIQNPTGCLPDWPHPVIVPLPRHGASKLPHFAVVLPGKTSDERIVWDGAEGAKSMVSWKLAESIGEGALLTSPVPIAENEIRYQRTTDDLVKRAAATALFLQTAWLLGRLRGRGSRRGAPSARRIL